MFSLQDYKLMITTLAKDKGWSNDDAWLGLGMFKEVGELWAEFERWQDFLSKLKKENLLPTEDQLLDFEHRIGSEFSGVMHYLVQFMENVAPNVNLDKALQTEVTKNRSKQKKTYENGQIVRK